MNNNIEPHNEYIIEQIIKNSYIDESEKTITNNIDNLQWITELGSKIKIVINDINNFLINDIKYISVNNYSDYRSDNQDYLTINNIEFVLSRFGFNFEDIDQFLLLFRFNHLDNIDEIEGNQLYHILENTPEDGICYIFIHKYQKYIEISYNTDLTIKDTECYICSINSRNKLILNIKIEEYPFMLMFPQTAPYLCYLDNIDKCYYVEFIQSSILSKNAVFNDKQTLEIDNKHYDSFFFMSSFKISPSMLFPTINSFNIDNYKLLFDFYYQSYINLNRQELEDPFIPKIQKSMIDELNIKIETMIEQLCNSISCKNKDITHFLDILHNITDIEQRNQIFKNYLDENFFCTEYNYSAINLDISKQINAFVEQIKSLPQLQFVLIYHAGIYKIY